MAKTSHIKPLFDYVLLKPLKTEEVTASGIVLPDSVKDKPQMAEVMAVGPGIKSKHTGEMLPMVVKAGQKVVYKKWGGNEFKVENEEWLLVEQKDIMAVME